MPCLNTSCGKSFGVFNRNRRTCHDCGIHLCRDCIIKTPATRDRPEKSKLCERCNSLALVPLMDAAALARATPEGLTVYLTAFGVSTADCKDKVDIIRLVVQTRNAAEAAMSFAGATAFNTSVTPTATNGRPMEDDALDSFGSFGAGDEAESSHTLPATPVAAPPPPPSDLPSPPGPAASGLEGFFAEQLLQLLMDNLANTEQTPRQTDEEYQREQGEERAKYQEMMKELRLEGEVGSSLAIECDPWAVFTSMDLHDYL